MPERSSAVDSYRRAQLSSPSPCAGTQYVSSDGKIAYTDFIDGYCEISAAVNSATFDRANEDREFEEDLRKIWKIDSRRPELPKGIVAVSMTHMSGKKSLEALPTVAVEAGAANTNQEMISVLRAAGHWDVLDYEVIG